MIIRFKSRIRKELLFCNEKLMSISKDFKLMMINQFKMILRKKSNYLEKLLN